MAALLVNEPTPLDGLGPDEIVAGYADRGLAAVSDERLVDMAAATISVPKRDAADSFILHAPLELLARSALLSMVEPSARELARQRLVWVAATYDSAGEPASTANVRDPTFDDREAALDWLRAAIDAADPDEADAAVSWLGATQSTDALADGLAPLVLDRLSAAAHGNILVHQLARIAPRSQVARGCGRNLTRELARHPDWALTWHRALDVVAPAGADATVGREAAASMLEEVLRLPPHHEAGSDFIFPTMSVVERGGLAADLLGPPIGGLSIVESRRVLLRLAAQSMLQDDPDHAPYGWSHCLTLPQAALGLAPRLHDPSAAIAVAATYVLGFRATQGGRVIDPRWTPSEPAGAAARLRVSDQLTGPPDEAAASAWHAAPHEVPEVVAHLAGRAAGHPDAHLAKYTLACFDAAADDPTAARLFLAAAAYLGAWWDAVPVVGDPLLS